MRGDNTTTDTHTHTDTHRHTNLVRSDSHRVWLGWRDLIKYRSVFVGHISSISETKCLQLFDHTINSFVPTDSFDGKYIHWSVPKMSFRHPPDTRAAAHLHGLLIQKVRRPDDISEHSNSPTAKIKIQNSTL
jgi:hypothetical protein